MRAGCWRLGESLRGGMIFDKSVVLKLSYSLRDA